MADNAQSNWKDSIRGFTHPRVVTMLFLGFSAGVPLLLIFSSLSLWLREAGVSRSQVTFFSWAALGYSFKFVWAPLVDKLPLPILGRLLGRRRSWLLLSQCAVAFSIAGMAFTDPAQGERALTLMAIAAVCLGFSSATQDIVIDAYRIESAPLDLQALLSSTYIAGYRIGMLVAGAGALYLAEIFGSTQSQYHYDAWFWTYLAVSFTMLVGIATTLVINEPDTKQKTNSFQGTKDYARFLGLFVVCVIGFAGVFYFSGETASVVKSYWSEQLANSVLAGFMVELLRLGLALLVALSLGWFLIWVGLVNQSMLQETFIDPVKDFFKRYGLKAAILLLLLIGAYRISDIVLGVIANVFYQDLGFSKSEIADIVKVYGLLMTIAGGFLGGLLSYRYGVIRILFAGAVLSALTNLLFMWLAQTGHSTLLLYVVISADNLSAGLATAAFVAFLSSLTNISFTAVQYAIFSSMMTLFPKILGGYSGTMVETMGYPTFFLMTTLLGLPVLGLIIIVARYLEVK